MRKQTKRWLLSMICLGSSAAMMAPVMAAGMHMGGSMHAGAPNVLPEYVVTASRVQTKNLETPASVTVITRKDIERNHYENVMAAVRNVPGVRINSYAGDRGTYSFDSLTINGTKKVVYLINGQRVNINGESDAIPTALTGLVPMDDVQRIEVLRGSAATLYGSDAVGGVINIITRKPMKNGVKVTTGFEMGSNQNRKETVYVQGREDNVYWNFGLANRTVGNFNVPEGPSVWSNDHDKSVNAMIGMNVSPKTKLELTYLQSVKSYTRPDDPSMNNWNRVTGNKQSNFVSLNWKQKNNDKVESNFSLYQKVYKLNDATNVPRTEQWGFWNGYNNFYQKSLGLNEQVKINLSHHEIITGIDYNKDSMLKGSSSFSNSQNVSDATTPSIYTLSLYAQDNWNFTNKWNAITGLRFVHHETFGNKFIPALTVQYLPNNTTTAYLTAKKFFAAPDLYQLYAPAGYGNPNLKPSTGHEFDLGAKHEFNDGSYLEGQLWFRHSENEIKWNKPYINLNKTTGHGLNLTYIKPVTKHLSANVGYAYTHINPPAGATIGNKSGSLPASQWDLGLTYHDMYFNSTLSARGVIGRLGNNQPQNQTTYWVFDWNANYRINKNAHAYVTVNNIFNKYYTANSYPLFGPNWYPAPGRSFNVGVNYNF